MVCYDLINRIYNAAMVGGLIGTYRFRSDDAWGTPRDLRPSLSTARSSATFKGRPDLIDKIDASLNGDRVTAHGLGGIGKSQIAVSPPHNGAECPSMSLAPEGD